MVLPKKTVVLTKKKNIPVLVKLTDNPNSKTLKNEFARMAQKISNEKKRVSVIGLYNQKVLNKSLKKTSEKWSNLNLIHLIYRGKKTWGGIYSVYGYDKKILLWHEERKQRDFPLVKNSALIKTGAWWIQKVNYYSIFCYKKNQKSEKKDFKARVEKYAKSLNRVFDDIDIFIFNDKVECRQFSSEKNREFLISMAAISPVNSKEFFRPRHTKKGLWLYNLDNNRGEQTGTWIEMK